MNQHTLEDDLRAHYREKANRLRASGAEQPRPSLGTSSGGRRRTAWIATGTGIAAALTIVAVAVSSVDRERPRIAAPVVTAPDTTLPATTSTLPSPPPDVGPTLAALVDEYYVVPAAELGLVGTVRLDGTVLTIQFANGFAGPQPGDTETAQCEFDYLPVVTETERRVRVALDISEPLDGVDACKFRWRPRQTRFELELTEALGPRSLLVMGSTQLFFDGSGLWVPSYLPSGWTQQGDVPARFEGGMSDLGWDTNEAWTRFWGPPPEVDADSFGSEARRIPEEIDWVQESLCGTSGQYVRISGVRLTEGSVDLASAFDEWWCWGNRTYVGDFDVNGATAKIYATPGDVSTAMDETGVMPLPEGQHYPPHAEPNLRMLWNANSRAFVLDGLGVDIDTMLAFARSLTEP